MPCEILVFKIALIESTANMTEHERKAVLLHGEPCDTFWDHWKAHKGLHTPYNNAGIISKVAEEIPTKNVSNIIFSLYR